jgi:hypothetical protein
MQPRLVLSAKRITLAVLVALAVALGASGCGDEQAKGDGSKLTRATGLDSAKTDSPVTVWAVGDGADGQRYGQEVARFIERQNPDRVLYLGDVYEEGTKYEFDHNYDPAFGRFASITAPTPGNHEWGARAVGYYPYWKSVLGRQVPDYYKFSIGGWEIFSLNSEMPHGEGSPQITWLRKNVTGPGTCRLAFWHRPRYSFGDHGEQPDVQPFWDVLGGRATLVVNGHEHNTERFPPRGGLTELVAGGGGRGLYEIEAKDEAKLAYGNDTDFAALRLRLERGAAEFRFVAVDGRTLDSGKVRCETRGTGADSQPVSAF